ILADTYKAAAPYLDTNDGGFLGAAVWWTLDDYWTQRPGGKIEHFGLYKPNGDPRPAGLQATALFSGGAGQGAKQRIVSTATGQARQPAAQGLRFLGYLAYGLSVALAIPAIILPVLERVQADWFIVVPFAGLLVGLFAALVGGLIGGLVAASYNRSPFGVEVLVEVPDQTA